MTTGEKIYNLRKEARITQEEFADKLQVTRQAVSKWEADAAYPETDKIIKIAQMFGVTCDYLLNDAPRYESDLVDKKNRDFLTMMLSFSLACIAVGFVVAFICFYAISQWYCSLVGLGVLAGLFLAAFILWSVGRYKFLSACSYSEDDKSHLAKWTKIFSYTAIITFFCYLPSVAFIGLEETLTVGTNPSLIEISAKVFYKLPFGLFILSQFAFAPLGIVVARLISALHDGQLGKAVSPVQFCDRICITVILSVLAFDYVAVSYSYHDYAFDMGLDYSTYWDGIAGVFLITACIFAVTLIVQICIRRKYEGVNKSVFGLQISCANILVINFALFFAAHVEYDNLYFYLNIVFGVALAAVGIALIVVSVKDAKKTDLTRLNSLRLSIPCYAFALMQLSVYIPDDISEIVWIALHCFIACIAAILTLKRKSAKTEN